MTNENTFEQVLTAFDNNDSARLMELITDDFEWDMVGDQLVKGRENVEKMFNETEVPYKMVSTTKDIKVFNENTGVCKGVVIMEDKQGNRTEQYYCDLYEFEEGKLKRMTTFTAPVKKE